MLALALGLTLGAGPAPGEETSPQFTETDPLSSNQVLAQRLLPPLAVEQARREMAARHQRLADQPLAPAAEQFRLFVPQVQPPGGYGLLVWVPPWQEAAIPQSWKAALSKRGVIMVTMARAGNPEPVMGRREPLAILAAGNVMRRYPVDSSRVYVGGFSGGSKVAFKLAVGYPDLFSGAFLLGGADALGEDGFAPPARPLVERLRAGSRILFVAGARDEINVDLSRGAAASLHRFCVPVSGLVQVPGLGHELVDQSTFSRALSQIDTPVAGPDKQAATCAAKLDARIAGELTAAEALLDAKDLAGARARLLKIDASYGGLAQPRARQLFDRIAPPPIAP